MKEKRYEERLDEPETDDFEEVEIEDVAEPLILIYSMCLISFVILFIELLIFKINGKLRDRI